MANDGNTLHDNAIGWAIISALLVLVSLLVWHLFSVEISDTVRWIRYGEMWTLQWFIPQNYQIIYNGSSISWHEWFERVPKWQKADITPEHLNLFGQLAMQPLKIPFCALLGLGALWVMSKGPRTHNRVSLGLEGLIERQSTNFPVIAPFVKFNPSKEPSRPPGSPVPVELPLFSEALGPEEWISYNEISCPDGTIDQASASKAFKKQLIARWKGHKALSDDLQIMLAAFCLKASRKRDEADAMLGRLACCWSAEKGLQLKKDRKLIKEARAILNDEKISQKTLKKAGDHAFITTAMMGALKYARDEGGVLAPAQFVWLRGHNRTLWYPLNNLGRASLHIEAIAAHAHFKAENMTKRPIPVPKIDNAVFSITEYMTSRDARPIPALDYSNSKKRGIKKAV